MELVWPHREYLQSYRDALQTGWSPDTVRGKTVADEQLVRIATDADAFLASCVDREAQGPPIRFPDGTTTPRLPGFSCWMWDGEFCGAVNFRWQPGTDALPPHVLGHAGYSVVPWKQRRGYATRALQLLLPLARAEGLRSIELTTEPDNRASRRVIELNGGVLLEEFVKPAQFGGTPALRFRIALG